MIANLTLIDLLDVVLMTVLIYQIYKLLIGSRAWNVFRGIALLAIIWYVAARIGLPTTQWLFDRAAPAALLATVIIFQPELRSALERVGQVGHKRKVAGDPVQEIVSAVRELASKRQGALITIEKGASLAEYGKVGSKLNSPVSSALLQTIFGSKGPLHDGAVIIKDDIITHAGAIFPVSDRRDGVPISHGTRHRAALGISENSDALAIVVSEERGTVSLALNGNLKSDVAPTEVIKALREVYRDRR
ncbi:MAG: diadenylate cyclase CdaA [Deinococcales bacterium]